MKQLNEIKPGVMVTVKRIDRWRSGGRKTIEGIGHLVGDRTDRYSYGAGACTFGSYRRKGCRTSNSHSSWLGDKVYVNTEGTTLSSLEEGDKMTIKAIEGGKAFLDRLLELGLKRGTEIEFLYHLSDDSPVLKIEDREIRIGAGLASKVLVEKGGEGRTVQI